MYASILLKIYIVSKNDNVPKCVFNLEFSSSQAFALIRKQENIWQIYSEAHDFLNYCQLFH